MRLLYLTKESKIQDDICYITESIQYYYCAQPYLGPRKCDCFLIVS